jgi:hypothetical protein
MAAGGGKPLWGVDIDGAADWVAVSGGRDLLPFEQGGKVGPPVEATAGEKREVDGGVGGV